LLMKYIIALLILILAPSFVMKAQEDSSIVKELQEVSVTADRERETPTHTAFIPTASDKAHSANAFDLISTMRISGIKVNMQDKRVSNNVGQAVVLCINGVEATADEVETMRSKNVISMELQRNPSGKYAGTGGVLNFKTVQYDYGGNVYLSAKETFCYNSGTYMVAADYSRKKNRLAVIYSNDWGAEKGKQEVNNTYRFAGGETLTRNSAFDPQESKTIANAVNLRFTTTGNKYRLSLLGGFADTRIPYDRNDRQTVYAGMVAGQYAANNHSKSYGNNFRLNANYTYWLPKDQIIDATVSATLGKNNYHYRYEETAQQDILSDAREDNIAIDGTLQYFKTYRSGLTFSTTLTHNFTGFNDTYGGTVTDSQTLRNNISTLLLQFSKLIGKCYAYASAGVSNMNVRLNNNSDNYINPTAYYGATYTPHDKLSLTFSGYYVHTLFDPTNKNDLAIPTSFFETTLGNPFLKPTKVLSHTIETNCHFGKTSLTATYMNYIYFDHIVHRYDADESRIYTSMVNSGNFYGNMFTVELAQRLFNDHLRISIMGIAEHNALKGGIYRMHKNILRGKMNADYTVGHWRMGVELATPYRALNISGPFYVKKRMKTHFYAAYDRGVLRLEAGVSNPFGKYWIETSHADYPCFDLQTKTFSVRQGRSFSLKAVYNFSYGKKTESKRPAIETIMNSAIMRAK